MAFGIGRGISTPLLALNFCMYVITAAIAGWALNKNIDSSAGAGGYVGTCRKNSEFGTHPEEARSITLSHSCFFVL